MSLSSRTLLSAVLCLVLLSPSLAHEPDDAVLASDMAEAGRRFLSSLTPAQRRRAKFPLASEERLRWHYVPQPRRGVTLGELDGAQRQLAYGFLTTALSRRGFLKASAIMALEEVLRRREHGHGPFVRDPGAYYLSLFGTPSATATWGWRLEGHHLSLNLTLVDGVHPVSAPAFLGAAPARVAGGLLDGTRVLGREEDLGFRLLASLDAAARQLAVFRATAPEDILTGPEARLTELPGLPAARMTPAQRQLLDAIVDEALGNMPRELAERERARIDAAGAAQLLFTWAGGSAAGQPHYYRVSGPTFLYEYDNTQENATHVHTVWHARDQAGGDFGVDLLRQHYREQPHGSSLITAAQRDELRHDWSQPIEPFHLVGNIYYVGAKDIAAYLIVTQKGLILIDTGTREMEALVPRNIEKLGFKLLDVKILLTSHAHFDHVEGLAAMKRRTGAQVMALAEEAPSLTSGVDLSALGDVGWDPVAVERVLHDGDVVQLGEVTLRALWTPGHTKGCTTWLTTAQENGKRYSVVFLGGIAANAGVKLLGNARHPGLVEDLAHTYTVLKALHPDIYLTGHPADIFAGKLERLRAGEQPNPLVDPAGYVKLIGEAEASYEKELRDEQAALSN